MQRNVSRIDINVYLPTSTDDYNAASCLFNDIPSCPHDDFNAGNGPYFSLQFFDSNCTNCTLSASDKNITGHFDPALTSTIQYSCNAASCNSQPLTFTLDNGMLITHAGSAVILSMDISFNESIGTFYYQDANYSVQKSGFNPIKSNVVVFPQ
jgi:hypothetical protein